MCKELFLGGSFKQEPCVVGSFTRLYAQRRFVSRPGVSKALLCTREAFKGCQNVTGMGRKSCLPRFTGRGAMGGPHR